MYIDGNSIKVPGVLIVCDINTGKPVILENGKIYQSKTNNLVERKIHLDNLFKSYKTTGSHHQYDADTMKLKAIEKHEGKLIAIPLKAYSLEDAKYLGGQINLRNQRV